jgi:hypothetical protein
MPVFVVSQLCPLLCYKFSWQAGDRNFHIGTRLPHTWFQNFNCLACFVLFTAALEYLLSHLKGNFSVKDFESACGIGITVSPEEIEHVVENLIKKHRDELLDKRYTEITTLEYQASNLHTAYTVYAVVS